MAEALAIILDSAKSGRIEIERRNKEDVLIRILPVLNDAFALKKAPQLVVGCYMLCVVLANKASLEDHVLDSLMEAVAGSWTQANYVSGVACLAVLAQQKTEKLLTPKVVRAIIKLDDIVRIFKELSSRQPIDGLVLGFINGSVRGSGKRLDFARISLVGELIQRGVLNEGQTIKALVILLQAADTLQNQGLLADGMGKDLLDLIIQLNESNNLAPLLHQAVQVSGTDLGRLELTLQTVLQPDVVPMEIEDADMADAPNSHPVEDTFAKSLEALTQTASREPSFLAERASLLFIQLAQAFVQASSMKERLSSFIQLPVLRAATKDTEPLFFSFFMRFFSGPFPATSRAVALNILSSSIGEMTDENMDLQAILPYTISALADPSERVRREAAGLLTIIDRQMSKYKDKGKSDALVWGREQVYGQGERSAIVQWLSARDVHKLTHRALLPGLEEYVLDADHIGRILVQTLQGPQSHYDSNVAPSKSTEVDFKKSLRRDLLAFLASHVNTTPLYAVKLRVLKVLNGVNKLSFISRIQALRPVFDHWRHLPAEDLQQIENDEQVSSKELEEQILSIIQAKDKEGVDFLFSSLTSSPSSNRPSFLLAGFHRLQDIWPYLEENYDMVLANRLFDIALEEPQKDTVLVNASKGLLRAVDLSGPILFEFVNKMSSSVADLGLRGPPSKKRRTSQNNMVAMNLMDKEMDSMLQKMTFILELVDGSHPENHPELLPGLFQTLTTIHHIKLQTRSEMSYLLSLNLGILLAIVNKWKTTPRKLNTSSIRADLIIDCVRTSESPQVQNTALLLVAGLATVAPELVLHSVMPIFTFMGSSVLRKDDEYSAVVIDQVKLSYR